MSLNNNFSVMCKESLLPGNSQYYGELICLAGGHNSGSIVVQDS